MASKMSEHTQKSTGSGAVFFDATLHPNRSLGPTGFRILMFVVGVSVLIVGILFIVAGAWPVFRSGRAYERVRLTERQLEVMRFSPRGEVGRWEFEPTWLQISMDDPPRHDSQLKLSSHGRSLVIGAFLTTTERVEVADALRDAVIKWRNRWNSAFAGYPSL